METKQELSYYNAYYSGLFSQNYEKGKFPKYAEFAPKKGTTSRPLKKQTWQEMQFMAKALTAALGGTFKTK